MKLSRWSLHPLALPYRRKIVWASTEETESPMLLLRLEAEDGSVGVAEVAVKPSWFGVTFGSISASLEQILLPIAKTTDVLDEGAFEKAIGRIPENTAAKTVLDNALWDLRSAIQRRSLSQRWEGGREAPLSCLLTRQAPQLMAAEAAAAVEQFGFREIKLKGGQGFETDINAVREVKKAVGDAVRIFVDTNSHYTAAETPAYLSAMADVGVVAMEDPYGLRPDGQFERIQRDSPIPILIDAPLWDEEVAALFCERGAQALSIKPLRCGLTKAWKQVRVAQRSNCKVHCGYGGESALGTLSSLQFAASLPGRDNWLAAELSHFVMLREQVIGAELEIKDGTLRVPDFFSCAELVDWSKVERLARGSSE